MKTRTVAVPVMRGSRKMVLLVTSSLDIQGIMDALASQGWMMADQAQWYGSYFEEPGPWRIPTWTVGRVAL